VFLTGPKPQLILTGLTRNIASGSSLRLNLTFQNAGTYTLPVPVMPHAVPYATYAPPQPTLTTPGSPSATPTPSTVPTSNGSSASPSPST
jgi:hypothetical protein